MASKINLSMMKGKSASTSTPLLSFRFNPTEEELEDLTSPPEISKDDSSSSLHESSVERPVVAQKKSLSGSPLRLPVFFQGRDEIKSSSTNSIPEDIERTKPFSNIGTQQVEELGPLHTEQEEETKTETGVLSNEGNASSAGKTGRDSSPIKDSVKVYFSKWGKRSSSFEFSPNVEQHQHDTWSLFSEIKGKFTKTLEERISKEVHLGTTASDSVSTGSDEKKKSLDNQSLVQGKDEPLSAAEKLLAKVRQGKSQPSQTTKLLCGGSSQSCIPVEEGTECCDEDTPPMMEEVEEGQDTAAYISASAYAEPVVSKTTGSSSSTPVHRPFSSPSKSSISVALSTLLGSKRFSQPIEDDDDDTETWEYVENSEEKPAVPFVLQANDVCEAVPEEQTSEVKRPRRLVHEIWTKICSRHSWPEFLTKNSLSILVLLITCALTLLPHFWSGLSLGILLTSVVCRALWWLFQPPKPKDPLVFPDYNLLPPLKIPVKSISGQEPTIHKGWMNEYPSDYNPETYHINNTHSIYVRLDGSSLRLSRPRVNVPKRAMWNEPRHEPHFVHQRHYDLIGATLSLPPEGLSKKRLWSKKYPICLVIPNPRGTLQQTASDTTHKTESPTDEDLLHLTSSGSLSVVSKSADTTPTGSSPKHVIAPSQVVLYLFSRTDREKEMWFQRFQAAAKLTVCPSKIPAALSIPAKETKPVTSNGSDSPDPSDSDGFEDLSSLEEPAMERKGSIDFNKYMASILQYSVLCVPPLSTDAGSKDKKITSPNLSSAEIFQDSTKGGVVWLNALIGRLFYDFLTKEQWSQAVSDKIQRKLSKIKIPYFMEELMLRGIYLGNALPQIQRTSDPVMDEHGLWIDLDVTYSGSFQMTLSTKLNLMKLKKSQGTELTMFASSEGGREKETNIDKLVPRMPAYNSEEEEDSAESSSEDEANVPEDEMPTEEGSAHLQATSTSKKFLRLMGKITQSRYFQQATENRYIKWALEEVSNTPLVLTVEVHGLAGTLAINIPPLPTDRLWYGFRGNPQLSLSARPKLGVRHVTSSHVVEWIEKKLQLEFQKILVMPNMDDLIIPIMHPSL